MLETIIQKHQKQTENCALIHDYHIPFFSVANFKTCKG
jgi:hypothetical protein